jgi:universal stress protein A
LWGIVETTKEIKRILVPVDFSDTAHHLSQYALLVGNTFRAKLFVLHVVSQLEDFTGIYVPHISLENVMEEMREFAGSELEKFCSENFKGKVKYEALLAEGDAYREILKIEQEKKIDLIVMGIHGKSGLDRIFFGSTTERVLRGASCPVMTIRIA